MYDARLCVRVCLNVHDRFGFFPHSATIGIAEANDREKETLHMYSAFVYVC